MGIGTLNPFNGILICTIISWSLRLWDATLKVSSPLSQCRVCRFSLSTNFSAVTADLSVPSTLCSHLRARPHSSLAKPNTFQVSVLRLLLSLETQIRAWAVTILGHGWRLAVGFPQQTTGAFLLNLISVLRTRVE